MKTIEIEGQKFEVPDWVKWVAQDENGSWCGFEKKPIKNKHLGYWSTKQGQAKRIDTAKTTWAETLRKI